MPKIAYESWSPKVATLDIVDKAEAICREYAAQGLDLTLRQLYYQFVARGLIANKQTEYKRIGSIVNDARMAGLLDWSYITDRTRNLRGGPGRDLTPNEYIYPDGYTLNHWRGQPVHVEVWVEKDALIGVIQRAVGDLQVAYFACRGYVSQSEAWSAGRRLRLAAMAGKRTVILHLGDHDPSGIDMTRDIAARLRLFAESRVEVRRIALTMDQIEQYDPPPNPAKETDARFAAYRDEYGDESWELDALEPTVLVDLIRSNISPLVSIPIRKVVMDEQARGRALLHAVQDRWDDVIVPALEDAGEDVSGVEGEAEID